MKNKGFTLVELIAVLIILAIISLIVAPLILNTVRRVKNDTNKRSIDGYGRAAQYAISNYELKQLPYPDSFDELEIDYHGNKVECETSRINPDHTIYLSKCKVNGKLVKDDKNKDGYYHFGILKMTNQEYVDTYGKNLEDALKKYHDEHNEYPSDYTTFAIEELDKEVACDVSINYDGTVYLNNCKVDNEEALDEENKIYVYGNLYATTVLLKKNNGKSITTYTDGNTHEMYTFDHEATVQTPALTDYRYIGSEPYNYVKFNGDELWRIIGIFYVENTNEEFEPRIKLIRNEKLTDDMTWGSEKTGRNWVGSDLNEYLNNDYYNSYSNADKKMISDSNYYLGAVSAQEQTLSYSYIYSTERSKSKHGSQLYTNWQGKIALMYTSDFQYAYALGVDNTCFNDLKTCYNSSGKAKGWVYNLNTSSNQYILTPERGHGYNYKITTNGQLSVVYYATDVLSVLPSFYLSPNVKIKSGDGTIDNPYEFEL